MGYPQYPYYQPPQPTGPQNKHRALHWIISGVGCMPFAIILMLISLPCEVLLMMLLTFGTGDSSNGFTMPNLLAMPVVPILCTALIFPTSFLTLFLVFTPGNLYKIGRWFKK
jgi:hypothetical protein